MNKFIDLLQNIAIPIVYKNSKRAGISVPYGVYYRESSYVIHGDNKKYCEISKYILEVYFKKLDNQLIIEDSIEQQLENNKFVYSKIPDIEISSDIFMTRYEIEGDIK